MGKSTQENRAHLAKMDAMEPMYIVDSHPSQSYALVKCGCPFGKPIPNPEVPEGEKPNPISDILRGVN